MLIGVFCSNVFNMACGRNKIFFVISRYMPFRVTDDSSLSNVVKYG